MYAAVAGPAVKVLAAPAAAGETSLCDARVRGDTGGCGGRYWDEMRSFRATEMAVVLEVGDGLRIQEPRCE